MDGELLHIGITIVGALISTGVGYLIRNLDGKLRDLTASLTALAAQVNANAERLAHLEGEAAARWDGKDRRNRS